MPKTKRNKSIEKMDQKQLQFIIDSEQKGEEVGG